MSQVPQFGDPVLYISGLLGVAQRAKTGSPESMLRIDPRMTPIAIIIFINFDFMRKDIGNGMILFLQEWLYSKLNIAKINQNITGIYYYVPSNSKFPYLYIGDFHSKNRSTKTQHIEEIKFQIVIYSRDKGLKNILNIAQEIRKLIHSDQQFLINYLEEKIMLQNDGVTHQISMYFKAIV